MRYWSGFATGIWALAFGLFAALALRFIPSQARMYEEFSDQPLPPATALVTAPAWSLGVCLVSIAAMLALNLAAIRSERRRTLGLAVIASLLLAALFFTYWALYLPITELAGKIRAD
jgi:hypothetical protein